MNNVAAFLLACEGRDQGIDERVLGVVAAGSGVLVSPFGSKYHVDAYLKGTFAARQHGATSQVLLLRDRDFDQEPTAPSVPWAREVRDPISQTKSLGFEIMLHRHEIENYLLDVAALESFFAANPPVRRDQRPSRERLLEARSEAARELAAYQAARWALGTATPRRLSLRTTWLPADRRKQLPPDRSAAAMERELRGTVARFRAEASQVDEGAVFERYQAYRQRFTEAAFYGSDLPVSWHVGSNLLRGLFERLFPSEDLLNGWYGKYLDEGPEHLVDREGKLWATDLQLLRGILQRWTQGEALEALLQPYRSAGVGTAP